jgi:hypothetical protein
MFNHTINMEIIQGKYLSPPSDIHAIYFGLIILQIVWYHFKLVFLQA